MTTRHDNAEPSWQRRTDRGALLRPVARPDGTLLVEGYAAREGVLEYWQPDGSVRRELVLADTLARSAVSLARAPVTLGHPDRTQYPAGVTPENVGDLGVGDVDGEVVIEDGGFVRVRMAVRRADAIRSVRTGTEELSCGYDCLTDESPGMHPQYGRYDAVQIDRRNNHLAIVDAARAGHEARIRVDGSSTTTIRREPAPRHDSGGTSMNARLLQIMALLAITGRYDSDDGAIDAIADALKARKDTADRAERDRADQLAQLTKERDEALTAATAATRERDELKAKHDAAGVELAKLKTEADKRADADERKLLEPLCEALSVDAAKHPKTADLKRSLAAVHMGPDLRADADERYIDAIVDLARKQHRSPGRDAGDAAWQQASGRADTQDQRPRAMGPGAISRQRSREAFEANRPGGQTR